MFRKSLLIVFTLMKFSSVLFGQNNLYDRVSADMCECLSQASSIKKISYSEIKGCMRNAMQKNRELMFDVLRKEYGDSANYEKGVQYGNKFGRYIDTAMVYLCDTYFRLTDSLRFAYFNQYNKDSAAHILSKINSGINQPSDSFYLERARLNFLVARYREALNDIEEASKDTQNKNTLIIIKALSLDKVGQYQEAADVFYQIASLSNEHSYLVSAAIENRKLKESK